VFRGINQLNLDSKGRLAIPSCYRDSIAAHTQVVITIDTQEKCLLIYPVLQWQAIEKQVDALSSFDPNVKRVQRLLLGHATDVIIDNNGRLLVPPELREYAQLTKKVVLVGQGKKFELWDETKWLACRETWLKEEIEIQGPRPDALLAISL